MFFIIFFDINSIKFGVYKKNKIEQRIQKIKQIINYFYFYNELIIQL